VLDLLWPFFWQSGPLRLTLAIGTEVIGMAEVGTADGTEAAGVIVAGDTVPGFTWATALPDGAGVDSTDPMPMAGEDTGIRTTEPMRITASLRRSIVGDILMQDTPRRCISMDTLPDIIWRLRLPVTDTEASPTGTSTGRRLMLPMQPSVWLPVRESASLTQLLFTQG
jgi:hypothetical protein